ncbi:heavy-metal-associated domain-containing protein [Polaribacter sp. L3A8]|uniref:heavy-metal-associated domain-containing protein n=1 Tax=Polaribacter sp. L3A8 TaxID=2686361 RepID=UPI00131E04E4|nr:heavy-metal-associated domain-containing protein [Polaribacter sp. L3A8]
MSLTSDNVIPGNHGKVFETNAKDSIDLESIKNKLLSLDGIKEVSLNSEIFPIEFTVYTTKLIKIKEIEDTVKTIGFHAIPKTLFPL